MRRRSLIRSIFFGLTLVIASLLIVTPANAAKVTDSNSLQLTPIYGHYDYTSSQMATVMVEIKDLSLIEAKHANVNQTSAKLQSERNQIISEINGKVSSAHVKRQYDYLFSGFALELPENQILNLATITDIKAIYPDVVYSSLNDSNVTLADEVSPSSFDGAPYVGAPEAWTMGYTGQGITVAIIDTGIDYHHPEISHAFGDYKGYDFVDNDNDPIYGYDKDGNVEFHATHVAGTIAATDFGIAPNVHLLAYRVLGGPDGKGTSDQVIAGIEQAVKDGADVMNLSLGNSLNDPDYATSIALDWAMAEGVVAVTSNGNAGPDNWTLGSPGASRDAISVGALDMPHIVYNVNLATTNFDSFKSLEVMGTPNPDSLLALNGNTYQYEFVGLGSNEEYDGIDMNGKVALIWRGSLTFAEKLQNAANHGAVAAIIFNNQSTDFLYTNPTPLPAFKLDFNDGYNMYMDLSAGNNTVTVQTNIINYPVSMADFSSRGPAFGTWMIKPDVSAPGVNITSLYPGGYYATADGTSMAAPHVTGAVALILQAHPDWTPEEVKAALMNTAQTIIDPVTGEPYPYNTQGAGSINIPAAIDTTTLVTPGSYSFGKFVKDNGKQVEGESFAIQNLSNERKTYTFEVQFNGNPDGIKVMTSHNLKVNANSTQQVHFNVQVDTSKLAPGYYEGSITVNDGQQTIIVPTILFVQEPDYPRVTDAGIQPNGDGTYLAYAYLPGGADYIEMDFFTFDEVNGAIGDYIGTPFVSTNVGPGYYIEAWDGTVNGQKLPAGNYVLVAYAEYLGVDSYVAVVVTVE